MSKPQLYSYPRLSDLTADSLVLAPLHPEQQPRSMGLIPIQPPTNRALPLSRSYTNSAGGYVKYGDAFGQACCAYGFRASGC